MAFISASRGPAGHRGPVRGDGKNAAGFEAGFLCEFPQHAAEEIDGIAALHRSGRACPAGK